MLPSFIYVVQNSSPVRGKNRTITVCRINDNIPAYIGCNDQINTASYRGDRAVANQLIADFLPDEFKMADDYSLSAEILLLAV